MREKLIASSALAIALSSLFFVPLAPAQAQDRDREMFRLHEACDRGDRRACVRFGVMIGESRERHVEWRRIHPEWFWWER